MGIFSTSSPFDQFVERATSEKNTSEDWGQIMDICDRVKENNTGSRDCLKSIVKRLNSENPRVVLQAITLLDACINNCGRKFLLEVASRDFEQELKKLLTSTRTHHKVSERLRESLKKWAEGEFKGDPQLSLVPSLYTRLKNEGYDFNVSQEPAASKKAVEFSTDPNVVNSKQEEDDIARAIQLSLQENAGGGGGGAHPSHSTPQASRTPSTSPYSTAAAALNAEPDSTFGNSGSQPKDSLKARALYDFEAAEDNELTFKAGEIVLVQDNSDPNWWKGSNHRGEGLFPANFVTLDLNADSELPRSDGGKRVSFSECVEVTEVEGSGGGGPGVEVEVTGEVEEVKIDRLLHLLHEADPTGERQDPAELDALEEQVNAMAPTIDADLEQIDRQHAQLARISTGLVDALALYHQLMREMPPPGLQGYGYVGGVSKVPPGPPPPHMPPHQYPHTQGMPPPPAMFGGPANFPGYMGPPGHYPPPNLPPTNAPNPNPQPPTTQPHQDFHQMPLNSHEGGNMMPGFVQYPPPPSTLPPNMPPPPQGPPTTMPPPPGPPNDPNPPTNFPMYPNPQAVQQPLL